MLWLLHTYRIPITNFLQTVLKGRRSPHFRYLNLYKIKKNNFIYPLFNRVLCCLWTLHSLQIIKDRTTKRFLEIFFVVEKNNFFPKTIYGNTSGFPTILLINQSLLYQINFLIPSEVSEWCVLFFSREVNTFYANLDLFKKFLTKIAYTNNFLKTSSMASS